MCMAAVLAFLPATDVMKGFETLKDCNDDSDVSEVFEYLARTYRGIPQQIGTGRRTPILAFSKWSLHQAVMDRKGKLNNIVQVWKRNFIIA